MAVYPRSSRTRRGGGAYMQLSDYNNATQGQVDMKQGIVTVSCVPLDPNYRHDNVANSQGKIQFGKKAGAELTLDDKMMAFTTSGGIYTTNGTKARRVPGPKGIPAVFTNFAGLWAPEEEDQWINWIDSDIQYVGQVHGFAPGSAQSEGDQTAGQYPSVYGGMDIAVITKGKAPIVNNSQKTFVAGDVVGVDMVDLLTSAKAGNLSNDSFVQPRLTHAHSTCDGAHPAIRSATANLAEATLKVDGLLNDINDGKKVDSADLLRAHIECSQYKQVITEAASRNYPQYATVAPIGVIQSGNTPNNLMSMLVISAPQ